MKEGETEAIRLSTSVSLPDNLYLFRLGIVLYAFASTNSFMCEIITHIDKSTNHTDLQDLTSGDLLAEFRKQLKALGKERRLPKIHKVMRDTGDLFESLNSIRNDIFHAYPITKKGNQQILHRRKDSQNKYFEVDNDFLERFIVQLNTVRSNLHTIRDAVQKEII